MALYKTIKKNGVYTQVKLKPSDIKQTIMRAHGWTSEQYRKQYDIFKNKLRAYESFREAHGAQVTIQSPQELLYKQAKAMLREGSNYTPSQELQRIQSFSAVSITKGRKQAQQLGSVYTKRRLAQFAATTLRQFKGLIDNVPMAKRIMEEIEDPVKQEEALKALAEHIHAKQAPTGEVIAGETFGSDDAGDDFLIEEWLD